MKADRDMIIAKSEGLFLRHGFKKVTMGDVADACKISRPTLYSVFPDKDHIFAACVVTVVERYKVEAEREIENERSVQDKLRVLFSIYVVSPFVQFSRSEEKYDILLNADIYAPEAMQSYWLTFESQLRAVLENSSRKPNAPAKDIAKALVSFGRDVRSSASSAAELNRLIKVMTQMAVGI